MRFPLVQSMNEKVVKQDEKTKLKDEYHSYYFLQVRLSRTKLFAVRCKLQSLKCVGAYTVHILFITVFPHTFNIHSFIYLYIRSFIHTFILPSYINSFILLFMLPLMRSFLHFFIQSFTIILPRYIFNHSFHIHLLITHLCIHSSPIFSVFVPLHQTITDINTKHKRTQAPNNDGHKHHTKKDINTKQLRTQKPHKDDHKHSRKMIIDIKQRRPKTPNTTINTKQ